MTLEARIWKLLEFDYGKTRAEVLTRKGVRAKCFSQGSEWERARTQKLEAALVKCVELIKFFADPEMYKHWSVKELELMAPVLCNGETKSKNVLAELEDVVSEMEKG